MARHTDDIEKAFAGLPRTALRLLCFLAFHGEEVTLRQLQTSYCSVLLQSTAQLEMDHERLMEDGYLSHAMSVSHRWHLPALLDLYRHNREWLELFRSVQAGARTHVADYLCRIAQLIVSDKFREAAEVRRPYLDLGYKTINLFKYVQPLFAHDARFMTLLSDDEFCDMVSEMLAEKFLSDELDEALLSMLEQHIPDRSKHAAVIREEVAAYRYFLDGTPMPEGGKGCWALAVQAIQALYAGSLDEALACFAKAIKRQGGRMQSFASPLLNYFYAIALYRNTKRSGDELPRRMLSDFQHAQAFRMGNENTPVRLLLEYIETTIDTVSADVARRTAQLISESDGAPLLWSLSYIVCKFFDAEFGVREHPHSARILQHEMSRWLPIGPGAKQELQQLYGGHPVIGSLRRRSSWELMLSDISERVQHEQPAARKRIVYFTTGDKLQSIEEQTLTPEGEWKGSKLLSLTQMMAEGHDSMDATDVMLMTALSRKEPHETQLDVLVAVLKDTGRLYVGQCFDGQAVPAEVYQEAPRLVFDGIGPQIRVTTNCRLTPGGRVMRHTVTKEAMNTFSLISVNALQSDIMSRILREGTFPSSALISLRRTMESLQGIVDVVDNIPDEIMGAAQMSKGIIAVRIFPAKDEYKLQLTATALEGGSARMVPGEGDDLVFDEADGLSHSIRRDMSREYENFRFLYDFVSQLPSVELLSISECKLWMVESLLKVLSFVHAHSDRYFLEWPIGQSLKLCGVVTKADINVAVKSDIGWFAVEGEVRMGGERHELKELLEMCCTSTFNGFIKLRDNEYLRISEKLKAHLAAMENLMRGRSGRKVVPKFAVGALAEMLRGLKVHTDKGYSEFMGKMKTAYAIAPDVPEGITATLRPYQLEGFQWLCRLDAWGAGSCLADDMGLGKTLQSLAFLLYKSHAGPSLVVAPKTVLPNWEQEAARFAPSLHVVNLNTAADRTEIVLEAKASDLILCTYGVLTTEADLLATRPWNVVCLDEAHQIKNQHTVASVAAKSLQASSRIILTGTPLQNHLGELWSLFQFINPGLLGPWSVFRDSFMIPDLDKEHKLVLRELTQPFILRRTKEEVLRELPEKMTCEYPVTMTPEEAETYERMREQIEMVFKKRKSRSEKALAKELGLNFFTELTRLRQAACSMRLIHPTWREQSSKVITLLDILSSLTDNPDNNIIVFSQFTSFLDIIKPELESRAIGFLYLDGQTPLEKRQQIVRQFQNGEKKVLLSSLKAGGLGINLTAANYVILLDPWWNPAIENQAMDRAHRIGQKRVVSVIRLVTRQTIEEKILRLHEKKQRLSDEVLDGTAESYKLTYEDVMDMVGAPTGQ